MTRRYEHVEAAEEEALKYGASFSWQRDGSKLTGVIALNGKSRKLFMSITPSDHRASKNIRKNVREYIREMSTLPG
jgi:hypothetical protein